MLVIHRHIHDQDRIDLTEWVTSVDITLSTSEPWTSIDVSLRLPFALRGVAPEPGDHITALREESGRAVAYGRVVQGPAPGLVREGPKLHSGTTRTRATSWMSWLREAQVYAHGSPARTTSVGTLFTLDEWNQRFTTIMGLSDGQHGVRLGMLVRMLGRLRLPQSLGGGLLGEGIVVAHDKATFERMGLHSQIDRILGPRLAGDQAWPTSTNALALVLSLFQPNRDLIECFEVLTDLPSDAKVGWGTVGGSAWSQPVPGSGPAPDGSFAGELRAMPTMVYRIKPWRMESFGDYMQGLFTGLQAPQGLVQSGTRISRFFSHQQALDLVRSNYPEKRTWPSPAVTFRADEVVAFDPPMRSDTNRVNAVTMDPVLGNDPLRFWQDAGLPLLDEPDIERNGLRLMDIKWPYFAPKDESLMAWQQVIAALGAQMYLRHERFYSGSLRVALRLELKPGEVFEIEMPDGRKFSGYAETIRHSVAREGPQLAGWTTISYSRGFYDGMPRAWRPSQTASSMAPATAPTAPAAPATTPVCADGRAAASWPTSLDDVDFAKVPAGLLTWARERGFRGLAQTGFPGGEDFNKRLKIAMACGYVIERYWQQEDPGARILFEDTSSHGGAHNYGAAFDFSVSINSPFRFVTTGNVPVFQAWGALKRLADAKRLPLGGRGLYTNVSRTGIRYGRATDAGNQNANPTLPSQAGAASPASKADVYPPGGSGATHYDFRGAFGLMEINGTPFTAAGTTWIWADINGDGHDDYRLGDIDRPGDPPGGGGGAKVYDQIHPDIKGYFFPASGKGNRANGTPWDPALDALPVGTTVPNIMQVLGQTDSCFTKALS